MKEFIDTSVFLGMHSEDEKTRIKCKNFFVRRFNKEIYMSFETVGECDDIIWSFPRVHQDLYYPFMDRLHTIMNIIRIPFGLVEVNLVSKDKSLQEHKVALNLALSKINNGVYYSLNQELASSTLDNIKNIPDEEIELMFSNDLEKYYKNSLIIKINTEYLNKTNKGLY